jgi:hypothetical protein
MKIQMTNQQFENREKKADQKKADQKKADQMTKDIEKTENENLPTQQHNSYEAYGAQVSQRNIVGQLLKFVKGRWKAADEEIEDGIRVIVDMRTLTIGWQKWEDDKPVDSHMGLVSDNYQPPLRKDIGDWDDKSEWGTDTNGNPRDPWQRSNMVLMREIGTMGEEGLYTFATSSRGGVNAIGLLSKEYGRKIREDNEALPIVELKADYYKHSELKTDIDIPVFKRVGWGTAADVHWPPEEVDEETSEVTETRTRTAAAAKKPADTRKAEAKKPDAKKPDTKTKKKTKF